VLSQCYFLFLYLSSRPPPLVDFRTWVVCKRTAKRTQSIDPTHARTSRHRDREQETCAYRHIVAPTYRHACKHSVVLSCARSFSPTHTHTFDDDDSFISRNFLYSEWLLLRVTSLSVTYGSACVRVYVFACVPASVRVEMCVCKCVWVQFIAAVQFSNFAPERHAVPV